MNMLTIFEKNVLMVMSKEPLFFGEISDIVVATKPDALVINVTKVIRCLEHYKLIKPLGAINGVGAAWQLTFKGLWAAHSLITKRSRRYKVPSVKTPISFKTERIKHLKTFALAHSED
jgi:hypothetical protein